MLQREARGGGGDGLPACPPARKLKHSSGHVHAKQSLRLREGMRRAAKGHHRPRSALPKHAHSINCVIMSSGCRGALPDRRGGGKQPQSVAAKALRTRVMTSACMDCG